MRQPDTPQKKKFKRSGRTIVIVTLGVLVYTTFIGWYDGFHRSSTMLKKSSFSGAPLVLQPSLERLIQENYQGDVFLVHARQNPPTTPDFLHSDALVQYQIQKRLRPAYPGIEFQVWRYRNLLELAEATWEQARYQDSEFEGLVIQGDQYWFDTKLITALILAGIIIFLVQKLNVKPPE